MICKVGKNRLDLPGQKAGEGPVRFIEILGV